MSKYWTDSDTVAASDLDGGVYTKNFSCINGDKIASMCVVYVDMDTFGSGDTTSDFVVRPYFLMDSAHSGSDAAQRIDTEIIDMNGGNGAGSVTVKTGAAPAADVLAYRVGGLLSTNISEAPMGRYLTLQCSNSGTAYTTGNVRLKVDFFG